MTPCDVWYGPRDQAGYGRVWREGRSWRLHRWVWTLANGPIPDGMCVCHHCDNRACFRLEHLFLGTHADNMRDMAAKGRAGRPQSDKTHCPQGHPYNGENTRWYKGGRRCRACDREHHRQRGRPSTLGVVHDREESGTR